MPFILVLYLKKKHATTLEPLLHYMRLKKSLTKQVQVQSHVDFLK